MSTPAQSLTFTVETHLSEFGYPADCEVAVLQSPSSQKHLIWYNGAVTDMPATVPNQSLMFDSTASTGKFYIKTGTRGGTDGTWKYVAVTT